MRKVALILVSVLLVVGIALVWRPAIAPIDRNSARSFEPSVIWRGEILAALGNCASCHTPPGGKGLAGGLALPTPFGNIYATNITPDPETGIGRWSEAAFARAMREGVDREGRHLYPAFPYDHFTLVSNDDIHALYAYVMTREPIKATAPKNELAFPYSFRPAIAIWKALYLRNRRYEPDLDHDAAWNRGAYLAEGIAHCSACHTPRNALGAEDRNKAYSGALVEGWYAYAINASSPAPLPWTEAELQFYLSHGFETHHGMARGSMSPVVANLSIVPADDVKAIATYIASLMPKAPVTHARQGRDALEGAVRTSGDRLGSADSLHTANAAPSDEGAMIYESACASCHESGRPLPYGGVHLSLSSAIQGPNPANIINVVLFGLAPSPGTPSPIMPGFRGSLTDRQIASLLAYLRQRFSSEPAWTGVEQEVTKTRSNEPRLWPSPVMRPIIADSSLEVTPW